MTEQSARKKTIKGETLKKFIVSLRKVNGYKASGVLTFQGKILARDSVDPKVDLDMVGSTFNDLFQKAHEASENVGLEACYETAINTPKGIIIIRCSGINALAHFHLIVVMGAEANLSLVKHELDKFLNVVMAELSEQ
jgi:predicted regulator of Ras-like GTPase activity (Roadblock/LC7/MglB family)